jgi:DNA polymerase lambda
VHVGQPATLLQVPQDAVFVTTDWVSRSIGRQALQPAEEYLPPGLKPALHPPVGTQQQQQQQQSVAEEPGHQSQPAAEPAHLPAPRPSSSTATIVLTDWQLTAAQQDVLRRVQCGDPPCRVERRGSEFVAVSGVRPTYTGGSTGIPWGSCGVWDEPVDEEGARQGFTLLKRLAQLRKTHCCLELDMQLLLVICRQCVIIW